MIATLWQDHLHFVPRRAGLGEGGANTVVEVQKAEVGH